jgi:hypothetical protein
MCLPLIVNAISEFWDHGKQIGEGPDEFFLALLISGYQAPWRPVPSR